MPFMEVQRGTEREKRNASWTSGVEEKMEVKRVRFGWRKENCSKPRKLIGKR